MLLDHEIAELRAIFAACREERDQRRRAYVSGTVPPSLTNDLRQLDACTRAMSERVAIGDDADAVALFQLTADKAVQIKGRLHRGIEHVDFA